MTQRDQQDAANTAFESPPSDYDWFLTDVHFSAVIGPWIHFVFAWHPVIELNAMKKVPLNNSLGRDPCHLVPCSGRTLSEGDTLAKSIERVKAVETQKRSI